MLKPQALRGSTGSHSLQSIAALEAAWRTTQGISFLPHRNVVFVVDDDAAMLRSVARMLRQFGYASLLFPSAEAFANRSDFSSAVSGLLDFNLADGSVIAFVPLFNAAAHTLPVI